MIHVYTFVARSMAWSTRESDCAFSDKKRTDFGCFQRGGTSRKAFLELWIPWDWFLRAGLCGLGLGSARLDFQRGKSRKDRNRFVSFEVFRSCHSERIVIPCYSMLFLLFHVIPCYSFVFATVRVRVVNLSSYYVNAARQAHVHTSHAYIRACKRIKRKSHAWSPVGARIRYQSTQPTCFGIPEVEITRWGRWGLKWFEPLFKSHMFQLYIL